VELVQINDFVYQAREVRKGLLPVYQELLRRAGADRLGTNYTEITWLGARLAEVRRQLGR
jgi:hypothetical protein